MNNLTLVILFLVASQLNYQILRDILRNKKLRFILFFVIEGLILALLNGVSWE